MPQRLKQTWQQPGGVEGVLQRKADLHEILLGLLYTSHISKGDASVRLHLKLGLALAKVEGVVASRARHAPTLSP